MTLDDVNDEREAPALITRSEDSREFACQKLVDHSPHQIAFGFRPWA